MIGLIIFKIRWPWRAILFKIVIHLNCFTLSLHYFQLLVLPWLFSCDLFFNIFKFFLNILIVFYRTWRSVYCLRLNCLLLIQHVGCIYILRVIWWFLLNLLFLSKKFTLSICIKIVTILRLYQRNLKEILKITLLLCLIWRCKY